MKEIGDYSRESNIIKNAKPDTPARYYTYHITNVMVDTVAL